MVQFGCITKNLAGIHWAYPQGQTLKASDQKLNVSIASRAFGADVCMSTLWEYAWGRQGKPVRVSGSKAAQRKCLFFMTLLLCAGLAKASPMSMAGPTFHGGSCLPAPCSKANEQVSEKGSGGRGFRPRGRWIRGRVAWLPTPTKFARKNPDSMRFCLVCLFCVLLLAVAPRRDRGPGHGTGVSSQHLSNTVHAQKTRRFFSVSHTKWSEQFFFGGQCHASIFQRVAFGNGWFIEARRNAATQTNPAEFPPRFCPLAEAAGDDLQFMLGFSFFFVVCPSLVLCLLFSAELCFPGWLPIGPLASLASHPEEPEPDGLPVPDPHEASVLVFPGKRVLFRLVGVWPPRFRSHSIAIPLTSCSCLFVDSGHEREQTSFWKRFTSSLHLPLAAISPSSLSPFSSGPLHEPTAVSSGERHGWTEACFANIHWQYGTVRESFGNVRKQCHKGYFDAK